MTSTACFITTSKSQLIRIRVLATISISLFGCCFASSQSSDAEARLAILRNATSLYRDLVKPWELRLSFTLNGLDGKQQDSGTSDVIWRGPRSPTEIIIQSGLINGKLNDALKLTDLKVLREAYLVQDLINETVNPVSSLPSANFYVEEQKRKLGKFELSCLEILPKASPDPGGNATTPQYCVEPERPTILRVEMRGVQGALRNRLGQFQNTNLALDNTIIYGGVVAILGKTESLKLISSELDGSSEKQSTADGAPSNVNSPNTLVGGVTAGRRLSGATPEYPVPARMQHESGTVFLRGIIDTTGHLRRLVPLASPGGSLTAAAIDAVHTWMYEPFMLNGQPTEVDTTIAVSFNLR